MPTIQRDRQAGRTQDATASSLSADLVRQQGAGKEAIADFQKRTGASLDRLSASLGTVPGAQESMANLRRDQDRQVAITDETSKTLLDKLSKAAERLERRHERQSEMLERNNTHTPGANEEARTSDKDQQSELLERDNTHTPGASEKERTSDKDQQSELLKGRQDEDVARLSGIRDALNSGLRDLGTRQEALLAKQRQEVLGAAVEGTLERDMGPQAQQRQRDEQDIRDQARDLLAQIGKRLDAERVGDRLNVPQGLAEDASYDVQNPAGRRLADDAKRDLFPEQELDPLRALTERIGERTAQFLALKLDEPLPKGMNLTDTQVEKLRELQQRFQQARDADHLDMREAGKAFHEVAAKFAVPDLQSEVPPGWRMRAEQKLSEDKAADTKPDSRLDLLFDRPGAAFNVDWKPTGQSALGAAEQMERYKTRIDEEQHSKYGIPKGTAAMRQESRSWTDYVGREPHKAEPPAGTQSPSADARSADARSEEDEAERGRRQDEREEERLRQALEDERSRTT